MTKPMTYDMLGRDGLAEIVDLAISEAAANIEDPNTDPKKARKIQITLNLKPNEQRNFVGVTYDVKSTLAPIKAMEFSGLMDGGQIHMHELGNDPAQHELPVNNHKVKHIHSNQKEAAINE